MTKGMQTIEPTSTNAPSDIVLENLQDDGEAEHKWHGTSYRSWRRQ